MQAILGLIVLTGPLFFLILWVPVCIGLGVFAKRKVPKQYKSAVGLSVGVLVLIFTLVLPFADEISGKIYFKHLCETDAKMNLYQTIELPIEHWDENGKPNFYVNWETKFLCELERQIR